MVLALLVVLLGIAVLLLAVGVIYQAMGTWRDRQLHAPPGRLVQVNQGRMHINVMGQGTPTVVFESGMGASCLSWTFVQPKVAEFARAVSYDRAGHGWSDPSGEPRTARRIAQELHALLAAAGIPRPYVLVGHSFGGYVIRAFAHLYRDEVVGMVLVDSVHPDEWKDPTAEQLRLIKMGRRYAWLSGWLARMGFARFCLQRLSKGSPRVAKAAVTVFGSRTATAAQRITGEIRKLPASILPMVRALWSQPKNYISLGHHLIALPVSAAQAAELSSLGDLPLVVLSAGHLEAPLLDWQRDLAQLSSRGRQVVASDSGHWIHLDQPELVGRSIRELVDAVRETQTISVHSTQG
jgi:pimeloyl-ACP methyl ester carboxylesterase